MEEPGAAMTLRIGRKANNSRTERTKIASRGFTLVELIVVMSLLTAIFALSLPSLSRFFHGRSLDGEAHRLLSTIRYTQSQAISLAIPMELRFDLTNREYGVMPLSGYEMMRQEPVYSLLEENVFIELPSDAKRNSIDPHILFLPDGSLEETSLNGLYLRNQFNETVWIIRTEYGQDYEIQKDFNPNLRNSRR